MKRPGVAALVASLVVPFGWPGPMAFADAPATPGPAAPSPTVVVPLVDISVSNGSVAPSASPTAVPTASPTPHGRPTRPAATPAATPPPAPATDSPDAAPTTIPTQPPTPRPLAPIQPSIPESLDDPNVQNILAHPGQLSPFDWMTGTWSAHTFVNHGGGRQRDLGKNTYVFAATMKGRWIFGGDGRATDYFYITYDAFARQWALVRLAGNPSYGVWLSRSGWRDGRITFESTYSWVNGRQYRRRVTMVHLRAKTFSIFDEEQLPSGEWLADQSIALSKP